MLFKSSNTAQHKTQKTYTPAYLNAKQNFQQLDDQLGSTYRSPSEFIKALIPSVIGDDSFSSDDQDVPRSLAPSLSGKFSDLLQLERDFQELVGLKAETFVYYFLQYCADNKISLLQKLGCSTKSTDSDGYPVRSKVGNSLNEFGACCWMSRYRNDVVPSANDPIDDTVGADFVFELSSGLRVYVEVKGHILEKPAEFHVTSNEWRVASNLKNSAHQIYIVIGVYVAETPARIAYVIENPAAQADDGELLIEPLALKCKSAASKLYEPKSRTRDNDTAVVQKPQDIQPHSSSTVPVAVKVPETSHQNPHHPPKKEASPYFDPNQRVFKFKKKANLS